MDAVVLNCVTQFNIVWCVGTFPFLPMSKCRRKTRCVTVAESSFLKKVSTANARCPSNRRCMITEGLKPLYPAMCVSPRYLQRCRHGIKFKSSNCFCPTLYVCGLPPPLFNSLLYHFSDISRGSAQSAIHHICSCNCPMVELGSRDSACGIFISSLQAGSKCSHFAYCYS